MLFALGEMVNIVSLAFKGTPAALATPSGGDAMTEIWPPFAKSAFP